MDLQLESGEYFLSAEVKAAKKWEAKKEKQSEKAEENKRKREAAFVPPKVSYRGVFPILWFHLFILTFKGCVVSIYSHVHNQ